MIRLAFVAVQVVAALMVHLPLEAPVAAFTQMSPVPPDPAAAIVVFIAWATGLLTAAKRAPA